MQAAGNLVARPRKVTVTPGPHLQHRRVVIGGHFPRCLRAQRRDRNRQGIVRVVLIRVPGFQQPDPGGQLGLHVQHPLAGRDQLLGQQPAQPASPLDSPGPPGPRCRPRHELIRLGLRGAYPQFAQRLLRRADHHRRMRALVRVDTDHHCCHQHAPSPRERRRTWRACLIPDLLALAPLLSHATTRTDRLAPRSKARPHAAGRRLGSQPIGPLERYGTTAASSGSIRRLLARLTMDSSHAK